MAAEADPERRAGDRAGAGRSAAARSPPTCRARCPAELAAEWRRADEQVFAPVRALLGLDQVTTFAVGAAPTPPEVIEFFLAMGIEICELWGMSETSSAATRQPARAGAGRAPSGRRCRGSRCGSPRTAR